MTWPPRSILVGTDFSAGADAAFRAALALARRVGARIDLVHVEVGENAGRARAQLDQLARDAAPAHVETHLVAGDPLTELLAQRELLGADLVAVGGAGLRGLRRALLGSVAGQLLHQPGCPLLLVTEPPPAGEFKKILVAQESFPAASPWLGAGLHLAHDERSEVVLLHVLPEDAGDAPRAERQLAALAAGVDRTVPAQVEVRRGDPAREIPAAARAAGVHLVVLGAERGGAPGRVADRVARAGLPALLVVWPEPESDEPFETSALAEE